MKLSKNILCFTVSILIIVFSLKTFALDQMAKEEKTPPSAEGALTTDQIPPIYSLDIDPKNAGSS